MTLEAEERAGRIVIRAGVRSTGSDSPVLEIERVALPFALSRAQITVVSIATGLAVGIFVVLVLARAPTTLPSVGPLVLLALWALVGHQRRRGVVIRVGAEAITVSRPSSRERVALDRIEALRVGEDAPYSTVWVAARDKGRVLLLDGLTRDEAELIARRLGAVIAPSA